MRLIDADELMGIVKLMDVEIIKSSREASFLLDQVLFDIQNLPTIDAMLACQWISAKDRLPIERQQVIVTDGENVGTAHMIANAWHIQRERDNVCGITHWMPLPEPPLDQTKH